MVHSYLGFDPRSFPSPTAPPPDVAGAAFDFAMQFGDLEGFTEEQLAAAIRIDPSQIEGFGPSMRSMIAMLEERKARILAMFETGAARKAASKAYLDQAGAIELKKEQREAFDTAVREQQVRDLEKLWYLQKNEQSPVARGLVKLIERLGEQYQVEQLAGKYAFTGRDPLTVEEALEVKEELETIDKLLEQLREAMKTAQLAIIDMDELGERAEDEDRASVVRSMSTSGSGAPSRRSRTTPPTR